MTSSRVIPPSPLDHLSDEFDENYGDMVPEVLEHRPVADASWG